MILPNQIIKEDHPNLRRKAMDVEIPLSAEDEKLVHDMMEYLDNSQDPEISEQYGMRPGVGLAAPQINILKKIFVVNAYDEDGNMFKFALINPKLHSHSVEKTYLPTGEGCLSVDREVEGFVPRHKKVTFKTHLYDFYDNSLKQVKATFKDYMAVVTQHEFDHLNGVLFFDRINQENPFAEIPNSKPVMFPEPDDEDEAIE